MKAYQDPDLEQGERYANVGTRRRGRSRDREKW